MKVFYTLLIILLNISNLSAQTDLNCFSIIVGKDASIDGSVFFAHNEDDSGQNFVDIHKVPRLEHKPGEKQIFVNALDSIDEVGITFGYLWISGSCYVEEQYLNEWGVAITSDGSRSKVTEGEARIQHNLRRIVIERARTAREAVKIAGALVEKYGYTHSGRTYLIVDPDEAWVFEVTYSKHWIARRLPDDEVAIIPNYFVIDSYDGTDTLDYLSSPDIVEYAIKNNWYDPDSDSSFNFREVYCREDRRDALFNKARKWVILNKLSEKQFDINDDFPFSFKPSHKLSLKDLMEALQNHYENTSYARSSGNGSPHTTSVDTLSVCNFSNDYSCITQLRSWLPPDIGNIMWIAPRYPCIQPFIPWYYGITEIPSDYENESYVNALRDFNIKNRDYRSIYPDHSCWVFDEYASKIDFCHGSEINSVRKWKEDFEMEIFNKLKAEENRIVDIYKINPDKARVMLTDFTNDCAVRLLNETREKLNELNNAGR